MVFHISYDTHINNTFFQTCKFSTRSFMEVYSSKSSYTSGFITDMFGTRLALATCEDPNTFWNDDAKSCKRIVAGYYKEIIS